MPGPTRRGQHYSAAGQVPGWAARARACLGSALVKLGHRLANAAPAGSPQSAEGDRFASLASMIPGVVYQRVVTPEGDIRYTYISEGSREVFGVAPDDVMKDPEALFKTYSDDYKANFRKRLQDASKAMQKWDVEASIVGPDGQIRYTHAIAKPEKLADGSVLWTGLILDATRIKQAEEELKAANRSVEAANKAKSLFLANMSHEIRTPMNGVLGMADLLLKTDLSGRQLRLLGTLRSSAQTLLGIINDVLDISRIEAGGFTLENDTFDLHQCLEDVIDLCASAAYKKGLEINLIIAGGLPAVVKGDSGRLRQVLINLVGNAVKFTAAGDATLRATHTYGQDGRALIKLEVIDTGIGIDDTAKQKLFAPFSQADSSISRRFGGTGLGLAITRHLVTLMGGEVDLDSEVGRGTKVTVALPMEVVSVHKPGREVEPLSDKRILVVDDRGHVRETIASKLHGSGALLAFADSDVDAWGQLRAAADAQRPFDAVIADRIRPGVENLDFCRTVAADPVLCKPLLVSIVSMNWKFGPSLELPFPTLAKPVRSSDLLEALCLSNATNEQLLLSPGQNAGVASASGDEPPVKLAMRVLVVEDNPVNQMVAAEYLTGFGCDVSLANDGEEAIQAVSSKAFDIVLMDCQMPVLDGLSAARRIRAAERQASRSALPIVAVTANAYESDRADAMAAGMNDFLVKPFSEAGLLEMLAKWKHASPRAVAA